MGNFLKARDFFWLIMLLACTNGVSVKQKGISFADIQEKEWKLLAIKTPAGDKDFSRQRLEADDMGDFYTLRFDSERVSGKAGPNRYTAPYQLGADQQISFGIIAGTRMAVFRESAGLIEQEYYDYLRQVTRWDLVQDKLELYAKDAEGMETVLVFGTG